jgi:hypothetical protein
MPLAMILAPLFAQALLVFLLLFLMGLRRGGDIVGKKTNPKEIALREPNWSPKTLASAYSFSNQFELPVLFYVLTILEIVTRHADYLFVALSWAFVVTRYLQALEHVTSNVVRRRGAIYIIGALILVAAWGVFAFRILLNLP